MNARDQAVWQRFLQLDAESAGIPVVHSLLGGVRYYDRLFERAVTEIDAAAAPTRPAPALSAAS